MGEETSYNNGVEKQFNRKDLTMDIIHMLVLVGLWAWVGSRKAEKELTWRDW